MKKFKRLFLVLLIFLGPGTIIWFISTTVENYFIELPYLGYTFNYDSSGNKLDSVAYNIPDFELTRFDGKVINRDSIRGKFIVLTTLQDGCPNMEECGLGMYVFNEIFFHKLVKNQKHYGNVKVISILTDYSGNSIPEGPSEKLNEIMQQYDKDIWWATYGDPGPFYSFPYYGDLFINHKAANDEGEVGSKAFLNSLVLIDDKGFVRGVTGAKREGDIRNFFDLVKLLKKEEFNRERGQRKRPK